MPGCLAAVRTDDAVVILPVTFGRDGGEHRPGY